MTEKKTVSEVVKNDVVGNIAEEKAVWADKMAAMRMSAVLNSVNTPARDVYGTVVMVDNVAYDKMPRSITTPTGDTIEACYKSSFHDSESGRWIDSYTAATSSFAILLENALGAGPWQESVGVSFAGQVTRRHATDGRETDTVRLA